jgi:hypothetical protein
LVSFLYRIVLATEQLEPISLKDFSIDACYRAEFQGKAGGGTYRFRVMVAIIADDDSKSLGDQTLATGSRHLVYFTGLSKRFEISYFGGYYARYDIFPVPAAGESNPLVLVRRNEGANVRNISYELYRVERDRLKRLWEWSGDHVGRSTSASYSISNLDFSGLTSDDQKRLTVYTTYGNAREFDEITDLTPKHRVTSFLWNATADAFVEERRVNQ